MMTLKTLLAKQPGADALREAGKLQAQGKNGGDCNQDPKPTPDVKAVSRFLPPC